MLMAGGGGIKGGKVHGQWPGLGELDIYQCRDLELTADVQSYAAWALRDLFAVDRSALEGLVFFGLDMGPAARIIS